MKIYDVESLETNIYILTIVSDSDGAAGAEGAATSVHL